jgi:signal transduction histidine kinase
MNLRAKLLLLIGLFCVLLIVVASLLIANLSLASYAKLERQSIERDLELANNVLHTSLVQLENSAPAYSYWEDTQHFVQGDYPEFLEDNDLLINPPPATDIDLMVMSNNLGDIKFARSYSSEGGQDVQNEVLEALSPYLARDETDTKMLSGALMIAGQPALMVVSPLLDSAGDLPATGTMVILLYLNSARIAKFSEAVGTPLALQRLEANSEDVLYARTQWQNDPNSLVIRTTPELIKGYLLVPDVFDRPVFAWGVEAQRTIYQQGVKNVWLLLGVLALASVVVAVAVAGLLERIVLSRLSTLSKSVRRISESGDVTQRTELNGKDELAILSGDINQMLSSLEQHDEALRKANHELGRSNHELEQFAYIASHDLQEPLRKVQAFSDRLATKYAHQLDSDGKLYIERMQDASGRMRVLIQDLLSYSRVKSSGQELVTVDLNKIVRDVVTDLEVRLEQSGGRVEVGVLPIIQADPLQMRQIFQNLIGNALKFKKPEVAPVVRVSSLELAQGLFEISIADNGIGFEQKYAERVFEVFQRLQGRSEYEGTGMGLAIVRKIVERHQGSIRAESEPGQGTHFIFRLPGVQASHEAKPLVKNVTKELV